VLLSVTVTDESVFSKVEQRKQPPSLGAAILLENEVDRTDYEFYFANEYIDQWFQSNATAGSSEVNLELLLGTQGWRANVFDLPRVYDISETISQMETSEQVKYQQLLAWGMSTSKFAPAWNQRGGRAKAAIMPMMAANDAP